jgi:serine/threonine protein kinase
MYEFFKARISAGNKRNGTVTQAEQGGSGSSPWPPTAKCIGPYVLGKLLGVGSTAQVFEGLDPTGDRKVAIKLLLGAGERTRPQAMHEAQIMSLLRHENITGVIGLTQVYFHRRCFPKPNMRLFYANVCFTDEKFAFVSWADRTLLSWNTQAAEVRMASVAVERLCRACDRTCY